IKKEGTPASFRLKTARSTISRQDCELSAVQELGSVQKSPGKNSAIKHRLEEVRAVQMRTRQIRPAQGRAPEIGDRLFSEPTAGTQPCGREPLFTPRSGHTLGQRAAGRSGGSSRKRRRRA